MGQFSLAKLFGITIRESATDGSDFTNPDADYRRLFLGEDGLLHVKDSAGAVTDPYTSGSGLSQSYIGYNTAGGSWETVTASRAYWKKVTLGATTYFQSIDIHLRPHVDNTSGVDVMIAADNSNAPGQLLACNAMVSGGVYLNNSSSVDTNARWLSIPIGATLAAADYWIGFMGQNGNIAVAYDGSGSDQYFTASQFVATGAYPTAWAITTSANKYSIRASILS